MDKIFAFLISIAVLGIYTFLAYLYTSGRMVQDADTAATIGGILNTTAGWAGLAIGYFVGSSAGSAAKDKTIAGALKGTGNGEATPLKQ